jgi:uncharacterized membrane protein
MTKAEFLYELKRKLKKLPEDEQAYALAYYDEYISEAGPEGEAAVIEQLGSPSQVASAIISDYAIKNVNENNNRGYNQNQGGQDGHSSQSAQSKSNLKTLWIVLLAIFAIPVGLPLVITIFVLALSILLVIFSVYLTLFVTAIGLTACGIALVGFSVVALFVHPLEAAFCFGSGLVLLSVGAAQLLFSIWLTKITVRGLTKVFAKILLIGRKREQS